LEELQHFFDCRLIGQKPEELFNPEALLLRIKRFGSLRAAPSASREIHLEQ
jgi:hypothetical protein